MSIKIMSWVWDNSPYEGKSLLVHLALADFANDEGQCWPSQATLAKKARCTERHVRDVTKTMVSDGYLKVVSESNGITSHTYQLVHRNSVPDRKSTTLSPEVDDTLTGNPPPKNRQEPSRTNIVRCVYCKSKIDTNRKHKCSAMQVMM